MLTERFGARMGLYLLARARFEDDSPVSSERIAVSESRETTFPTDVADRAEQVAVLRAAHGAAVRGPGQERAPRPHDRDQGPARRLHDRDPRPHAPDRHQRPRGGGATSPARCSTSTRRRGRVRLLGVRVAAFAEDGAPAEDASQMTLAL